MSDLAGSTIVNIDPDVATTFNDFFSRLISTDANTFLAECKTLVDNNNYEKLMGIYTSNLSSIFSLDSDSDIDGCIQSILSIMYSTRESDKLSSLLKSLVDAIASDKTNKPKSRLRELLQITNLSTLNDIKYHSFVASLKYAVNTKQTNLIANYHSLIQEIISSWSLSAEQATALYLLISEILLIENQTSLSIKYLCKHMKDMSGDVSVELETILKNAILHTLKHPVTSFPDRMALLENVPSMLASDLSKLVELMRIMCSGSLKQYMEYESKHATFMSSQGLLPDDIKHCMHLLAICDMSLKSSEITFVDIATLLNIEKDQVETWVVEAISYELIEAVIDQPHEVVYVSRSKNLTFGDDRWQMMKDSLTKLTDNIRKSHMA